MKRTDPQSRLASTVLPAVILLLCFGCVNSVANPQVQTTVGSGPSVRDEFAGILQQIIQHWNVTIIAEGSPIAGPSDPKLAQVQPHDTPELAVARLASAFDYMVTSNDRVYVLTKKYTDPNDIPDLTPEEASRSMVVIARLLRAVTPQYAVTERATAPQAAALVPALSPEHLAGLSLGGVSVTSLSADEYAEVRRFALYIYTHRTDKGVEDNSRLLEAILKQDPVLRWKQLEGADEFGYTVQLTQPARSVFKTLSHPDTVFVSDTGQTGIGRNNTLNGVPTEVPDATDPGPPVATAASVANGPNDTLQGVVSRLNVRSATGPKCTVDRAFADKSVTIAGEANSSTSRVMLGIADVYGLEVRHGHDGTMVITHNNEPSVEDVSAVAPAVYAAIPRSVLRLLQRPPSSNPNVPGGKAQQQWAAAAAASKAMRATWLSAMKRVRAAAQAAVLRSKTHVVHLSELAVADQKAFAVSQSLNAYFVALMFGSDPAPQYIANFDRITLTGAITKDEKGIQRLALFLSYTDPATGQMRRGVGIDQARISPL